MVATALVTGGAGFIGSHLAGRLVKEGMAVRVFDSLVRPGSERHARYLAETYGPKVQVVTGDMRDRQALELAATGVDVVFHLAAVPGTSSDPMVGFDVNLGGTLLLLETLRAGDPDIPLLYTSTHQVYAELNYRDLVATSRRYEPAAGDLSVRGLPETTPLSFHGPHGCSKGAAEQYVLDYARMYDLATVVFRLGTVYGPNEQGWVTNLLVEDPVVVHGDEKQVRDLLYIDDLVDAMFDATRHIDKMRGEVFNVGGGPTRSASVCELLELAAEIRGHAPAVQHAPWRQEDRLYYTSDTRRFEAITGWKPRTSVRDGLRRFYDWLCRHRGRRVAIAEQDGRAQPGREL
jgi:CDP-paratose 2-epimerase